MRGVVGSLFLVCLFASGCSTSADVGVQIVAPTVAVDEIDEDEGQTIGERIQERLKDEADRDDADRDDADRDASASDGAEGAEGAEGAGVAPTGDPAECEIELVEDEYGFEVAIEICGGSKTVGAEAVVLESMADFIGSDQARTLMAGFRDRFIFQSGCSAGDVTGVELVAGAAVRPAAASIPDDDVATAVRQVFIALSAADEVCEDAEAWIPATRRVMAAMQAVEELVAEEPGKLLGDRPGQKADLTLVTADAMAHYDRLYAALVGLNVRQSSDFWFSSSHLLHVRGLRMLEANGLTPQTYIAGNSIMARAVDPVAIQAQTGAATVSIAMVASPVPVHLAAIDYFLSEADGPRSVVWGDLSDTYFQLCNLDSRYRFDEPVARQRAAFAGVRGLIDAHPHDLMFGSDPLAPTYVNTPILDDGLELHEGWELGALPANPAPLRSGVGPELNVERYAPRYRSPEICAGLVDLIAEAIGRWTTDGHSVTVAMMPLPDKMAELHPDGRAGHDEAIAAISARFVAAGATMLDVSAAVEVGGFNDATHVNELGRDIVTNALAASLNG